MLPPVTPLNLALIREAVAIKIASTRPAPRFFRIKYGQTLFGLCGAKSPDAYPAGAVVDRKTCTLVGRYVTPAMPRRQSGSSPHVIVTSVPVGSGYYGEPGPDDAAIGSLWESAGGPASQVSTAECIAWHESDDRIDAISPSDDSGLWQINIVNAPTLEMENPIANADEAVHLWEESGWSPWTTASMCGV